MRDSVCVWHHKELMFRERRALRQVSTVNVEIHQGYWRKSCLKSAFPSLNQGFLLFMFSPFLWYLPSPCLRLPWLHLQLAVGCLALPGQALVGDRH